MQKRLPDVTFDSIVNHDTWNTCPHCFKSWKSKTPIKGTIHRTIICSECFKPRKVKVRKRR